MTIDTTSADFFEAMYNENHDPWEFSTNRYELNRYARIVNLLNHKRYKLILEPGCSIGVLTEKLSPLADSIEAFDISPTATKLASIRCSHLKNVSIRCESLLDAIPNSCTDLLLLSEIGYYFEASVLSKIINRIISSSSSQLSILACHSLKLWKDHILSGDKVHTIINSINDLSLENSEIHDEYRLDYWLRRQK